MKLVAYLRVSTDSQAEDGYGLDVQERTIRAFARANKHRVVATFRDEGVSGANGIDDRVGLPRALEAIRGGGKHLIVARLDRLARAVTVQEAILATVWKRDAQVFAVDMGGLVPPDDPDDPMRTAMRQMAGVFAELDRRLIAKRLKDGRTAKAAKGGYTGGAPPYGYRVEQGELRPDPKEQAALTRMHELRAAGCTTREIAATLAHEGHPTKRDGNWTSPVVARILSRGAN